MPFSGIPWVSYANGYVSVTGSTKTRTLPNAMKLRPPRKFRGRGKEGQTSQQITESIQSWAGNCAIFHRVCIQTSTKKKKKRRTRPTPQAYYRGKEKEKDKRENGGARKPFYLRSRLHKKKNDGRLPPLFLSPNSSVGVGLESIWWSDGQ